MFRKKKKQKFTEKTRCFASPCGCSDLLDQPVWPLLKLKCVWTAYDCRVMLIIVKTFWMFAYITTEYVGEVSLLCISYTCIVNFLSSLCCQTDYLFCYISINVILLLKTSRLALFFPQRIDSLLGTLDTRLQKLRHANQQHL